jgi:hypothetical protein
MSTKTKDLYYINRIASTTRGETGHVEAWKVTQEEAQLLKQREREHEELSRRLPAVITSVEESRQPGKPAAGDKERPLIFRRLYDRTNLHSLDRGYASIGERVSTEQRVVSFTAPKSRFKRGEIIEPTHLEQFLAESPGLKPAGKTKTV